MRFLQSRFVKINHRKLPGRPFEWPRVRRSRNQRCSSLLINRSHRVCPATQKRGDLNIDETQNADDSENVEIPGQQRVAIKWSFDEHLMESDKDESHANKAMALIPKMIRHLEFGEWGFLEKAHTNQHHQRIKADFARLLSEIVQARGEDLPFEIRFDEIMHQDQRESDFAEITMRCVHAVQTAKGAFKIARTCCQKLVQRHRNKCHDGGRQ